jgi:hypothetical protein
MRKHCSGIAYMSFDKEQKASDYIYKAQRLEEERIEGRSTGWGR